MESGPWRLTYYMVDGSYLKVEIDADGSDWQQKLWRLYYPDGRVVVGIKNKVQGIFDANGNGILIQRVIDQTGNYTAIFFNDYSNRQIVIQHAYAQLGAVVRDKITVPGPDSLLTGYVDWIGNAVVGIQVPSDDEEVPLGTLPPIYHSYAMGYDSALSNLYELRSVRTPLGSTYKYTYRWDSSNIVCSPYPYLTCSAPLPPNAITQKQILYYSNNSQQQQQLTWTHQYTNCSPSTAGILPGGVCTDITNPDGGLNRYYHSAYKNYLTEDIYGALGLVYRIDRPDGSVVKRNGESNKIDCCGTGSYAYYWGPGRKYKKDAA
jgi:hypothetical protein